MEEAVGRTDEGGQEMVAAQVVRAGDGLRGLVRARPRAGSRHDGDSRPLLPTYVYILAFIDMLKKCDRLMRRLAGRDCSTSPADREALDRDHNSLHVEFRGEGNAFPLSGVGSGESSGVGTEGLEANDAAPFGGESWQGTCAT